MQPVGKQKCLSPLRMLLLCLDWACIVLVILLGIGISIIQKRTYPVPRPVFTNDPTIAYEFMGDKEMHFAVALVVPFAVLVAAAVCMECWAAKQGWRKATWILINIFISLLATLAVVGFLTELFKRLGGRLRPDFLDRCAPTLTADATQSIPFGTLPTVVCQNTDGKILKDGHMSFPSGHSSCAMAIGLYAALYVLWCMHWRQNGAFHRSLLSPAKSILGRIAKDLLGFAVLIVVLFEVAWPWGVAVSRFRDNRHNISDVLGGMFLALCFVPVFLVRLVGNLSCWESAYDWTPQQQQRAMSELTHVHVVPAHTASSNDLAAAAV